jgi:tetratricopeptide (TPR) repeat protein
VHQQIKTLSFKVILLFLLTGTGLIGNSNAFGQKKINTDSLKIARQKSIDSVRAAQQKSMDSARVARQKVSDSMKLARQHVSDSLATIRKYRESKRYKDSVANVRQDRLDSMKTARAAFYDSLKAERDRVSDSLFAIRKAFTDSIQIVQKRRTDSLATIRKYRESKRYKDSVALVRQIKTDSARVARKAISDELIATRKRALDSATAVRKAHGDSLMAARKAVGDALKSVRKAKSDSLAKVKESKERLTKSKQKLKTDQLQLALDLKIKKKHEAWSNEKMLKKKWSAPRRFLQNTYTHYNYYFNADKKMDEALANMQRGRKENYDSLIALFPFDPDRDSSALSADMDSIIQKASLGIQIHDPRTKWADDLYLLLGQSYYYKGNYDEASTAFKYIISSNLQKKLDAQKKAAAKKKPVDKNTSIVETEEKGVDFLTRKSANNEAILWLARTYTESHKENEAESILDLLDSEKDLPDELKGRVALEKAYLNLGKGNYKAASDELVTVADDSHMPDWVRLRAAYLGAQILYNQGNYGGAATQYQKVIDLKPKIEMDFYARKNLAYSLMESGGSQESATASLRGILKDNKYQPYHEQVYYILGRLSANNKKYDEAITYLRKSIESSKSTKKQKALSFASLGNVYYARGDYNNARLSYDSASALARYAPNDDMIAQASKRSKVLDQVVGPSQSIRDLDSLLALSSLSEKEQRSVVRQYIRSLENKKADSAFRAENAVADNSAPEESGDPGGGWYFSNPALMQQGANDFKRKWGTRQNVDNWRRVGGQTFTQNNNNTGGADTKDNGGTEVDDRGIPTEASLLAAIPNTAEEKASIRSRLEAAYTDIATAYINELEDYTSAKQTLDTFEKRFPDHSRQAEALYLRYQLALKQDRLAEAQTYSNRLTKDYGDTKWAKQVRPLDETEGLLASTNKMSVANYYDEAYGLMMQRQYEEVLKRAKDGQKQYSDPVYNSRFRIMEAISLAGSGNYEQADTLLTQFISSKPSDSLRIWAESVMAYVKKNKPVVLPPAAKDTTAGAATNAVAPPAPVVTPPPATYAYQPQGVHYVLFYFKKMESKAMGVKAGLTDFNTFNYSNQSLNTNLEMLKPDQGIITIKQFPTAAHAKIYINAVKSNNLLLKEYKSDEYQMMVISENNYKKLAADKDVIPYTGFYKANYK